MRFFQRAFSLGDPVAFWDGAKDGFRGGMDEAVLACRGGSWWDCVGRAEVFVVVARWGGGHGGGTSLGEVALEHRDVLLYSVSCVCCGSIRL